MNFHVGPVVYTLVVSDRAIFDTEGNELEGVALEGRRLLLLSRIVEPERREEVALHEYAHAWRFNVPEPSNEEELARFTGMVAQQFYKDLDAQGGRDALVKLPMQRVNHIGRPAPTASVASVARQTVMGAPDRMCCPTCEAEVMCGSIHNGEPFAHDASGKIRIERWMECEACGSLTVWLEVAAADGTPLGEFVSNPPPRVMRGLAATQWVGDHAVATVG